MQLVRIGRRELLQKALGFLERARTLAPERPDVRERLFMVSLMNGSREQARQTAIFIFRHRQTTGDVAGAEQVLQAYLRVFPDSPEILEQMQGFYGRLNQQDRWIAWLLEMTRMAETEEAFDRAGALLQRVLKVQPDHTEARERLLRIHERQGMREKITEESLTLADSLASQGNAQAAADLLIRAKESAKEDPGLLERIADGLVRIEDREQACVVLLRLGKMALRDPSLQERAVGWLMKARDLDPQREEIYDDLAAIHVARGDRAGAASVYRDLLERMGPDANPEKQIAICRKMAQVHSDDVECGMRLSRLLLATGRSEEGLREIRRMLGEEEAAAPDEAVVELLYQAVELHPSEMDLWRYLGKALSRLDRTAEAETALLRGCSTFRIDGKLQEAARLARVAIEISDESMRAHEMLAAVLQDAGSHDEALTEYYALASRLRDKGEKSRATGFLEKCVELATEKTPYFADLVSLSRESEDLAAAERWERRLIADLESDEGPQRLIEWLKKALQSDPSRIGLSSRLMQETALREGESASPELVRDHLERVEKYDPERLESELERFISGGAFGESALQWALEWSERTDNRDARKRILFLAASEKEGVSEWAEATRLYERCLEIDQSAVAAARGVCRCLEATGDRALGGALILLAGLLRRSGEGLEAVKTYRRALTMMEEPAGEVVLAQVETLEELGRRDEAVAECQRWIGAARDRNKIEDALVLYEKAVSIDPENTRLLRDRSRFLESAGEKEKAVRSYFEAGELYLEKDLAERAIENFRRAKYLSPENPEILERLAGLFVSERMYRAALKELSTLSDVYRNEGDLERADVVRRRMQDLRKNLGEEPAAKPAEEGRAETPTAATAPGVVSEVDGDVVEEIRAVAERAEELAESGKIEEAVEAYRDAAARFGDLEGGLEEASRLLQAAWKLNEENEDIVDELTLVEARLGRRGVALELLQQAAERSQRTGDYERAADRYGRMLDLGCVNLAVRTGLAWSLAKSGKKREAAGAFRQYGRLLLDKELPEEALSAYRKAISLWPEDFGVRKDLIELLSNLGRAEESREERIGVSRSLAELGRNEEALEFLQEILKSDPKDVLAREEIISVYSGMGQVHAVLRERKQLARVYLERGERKKAVTEYEEILELGEEDPMLYLVLAEEYRRLGNRDRARDLFIALADFYSGQQVWSKAASCLQQVVQLDPKDIPVRQRLAEAYNHDGLREKAVLEYLRIADDAMRRGDEGTAIAQYERVRTIDPQNVRILGKIADCHIRRRDVEGAVGAALEMSRVYRERGILSKAIEVVRRSLQHFPTERQLLEELGDLYLVRNLREQALGVFRDLVRSNPQSERYRTKVEEIERSLGMTKRTEEGPTGAKPGAPRSAGSSSSPMGGEAKVEQARPAAKGAGRHSEDLNQAKRSFQKGRYLKAMEPLKKIIATTSAVTDLQGFLDAHALLAECFIRLNRPKEAVDLLMKGLSSGAGSRDESLELRYLLGLALEKDCRLDQAIQVYKKVHEIKPTYRDVKSKILWARTAQRRAER